MSNLTSRYQEVLAQMELIRDAVREFRVQLTGDKFKGESTVKRNCPHCLKTYLDNERKDWISTADVDRWLTGVQSLTVTEIDSIPAATYWCEDCQMEVQVNWKNRAPLCADCGGYRILVTRKQ